MQGLTQSDLSSKTGLTVRGIQRIESGAVRPNEASLRQIALALDLPVEFFLNSHVKAKMPVTRRLVVELELPPDAELSEPHLSQLRDAMLDAGRHILKVLKEIDNSK